MSGRRFSQRGQPPTDFERELVASNTQLDDIWAEIGKVIGVDALRVVLDRLGGEIVSVPTWERLIGRLYLPVRDAEILAMSRTHPTTEVAAHFRVSERHIKRVRARARALRTRHARG